MTHNILFKQTKIYYETYGNNESEPIVMLHPAFGDRHIYSKQIVALEETYYLIMIDMIGHGQSQPSKSNVNMGDMPDIISMILKELNFNKAHILGCSLGSLIAQGFAYHYPDQVLSVTVIGGYSIHKDNSHILKAQRKEMGKWLLYIIFSMKRFRNYVSKVSAYSEDGKAAMRLGASAFTRGSFRAMQGMDKIMVQKEEPVPYPLLLICGQHDLALAKDAGKALAKVEPKAQYIEIENAGHCANIDRPDNFNDIYRSFLVSL